MQHPLCKGKVMDLPSRSAAVRLRQLAQSEGAVPIATFMAIANAHYYATRNPFGGEGDFINAPETSQMFGELIGLWAADLWKRNGRPHAALVDLGIGRGTLMATPRRAAGRGTVMSEPPVQLYKPIATISAHTGTRNSTTRRLK